MTAEGLPVPQRYLAIFSVTLGTLLLLTDTSISVVALPTIARDLNVRGSAAILIVTVYQLVLAMTIMAFSALGDRVGQRRVYQAGLVVYCLSAGLCFMATSLWALLAIRTLQGLGVAAALSVTFGLIRSIYPPNQLGRGLGLNTLASASGMALAPVLAGLVLSIASWRWVFVAGVPLAIASLLAGRSLPFSKQHQNPFDVAGAVMSAATVGLIMLGFGKFSQREGAMLPCLLLCLGIGVGYFLVRHQRRQQHPVLPIDLLSMPPFSVLVLGALMAIVGSTILLVSSAFRLQHVFGFSPAETGAMIAPYALASMMIAPISGVLSDRISPILLGVVGMSVATTALLLVAYLPSHPIYFDVAWRIWLCGAGFGMFLASNARLTLAAAPVHRTAAAGGLLTTTRMLSQALGATLVAGLLAFGLGDGAVPTLIGATLAMLAGLSAILRPGHRRTRPAAGTDTALGDLGPA